MSFPVDDFHDLADENVMSVPVRIDFTDDFRIDVLLQNGAFIELAADEYPRCLLKGDSPVSELRGKRGLRNLVAVPSGELAEYGEILPSELPAFLTL